MSGAYQTTVNLDAAKRIRAQLADCTTAVRDIKLDAGGDLRWEVEQLQLSIRIADMTARRLERLLQARDGAAPP